MYWGYRDDIDVLDSCLIVVPNRSILIGMDFFAMGLSSTELQVRSSELFSPDLASEINNHISHETSAQVAEPFLGSDPGPTPKSIATGFLGDKLYNSLTPGRFQGLPLVRWNGFDTESSRPTFVFVRDDSNPFSYTTSDGRVIEPMIMDTDGGTIPLALHSVKKFSPWGYAPAYIIHDWIFVAHKCNTAPDNDWTFEDSATLLAETIKTLMTNGFADEDGEAKKFEKAEDTLYLIYQAVRSTIARRMWDNLSNVECRNG